VTETYPRQKAATRNFQLGAPRTFHITSDASLVTFLRSDNSRDAVNSLWVFDISNNIERKVADARALLRGPEDVPAAELARRERMRETTAGITSYSTDDSGMLVTFSLSGQLFVGDIRTSEFVPINVTGPIIDPHMSPNGQLIAWSTGSEVRLVDFNGDNEHVIAHDGADNVTWGLADFISAEELGRVNGLWWSPNSDSLLLTRVDESPVNSWWISDPAQPEKAPHEQRYPAAGTTNADVQLYRVSVTGEQDRIEWDATNFEYLVRVAWQKDHEPLITLSARDQKCFEHFSVVGTELHSVARIEDASFIDVIPGQPRYVNSALLTVVDDLETDTRRIYLDGLPLSPVGIQVMSIVGTDSSEIYAVITNNAVDRQLVKFAADGTMSVLTPTGGVAHATPPHRFGESVMHVTVQSRLREGVRAWSLVKDGVSIHEFDSLAESPNFDVNVELLEIGDRKINTAVIFPRDHELGSKKLPVLMRPYGGPHGAMVLNSALIFHESQWFADQGYCVIIADNRGTPGRGPVWDRSILNDFVRPVLDDQVDALQGVAEHFPLDVDTSRVGITGWSFGGYLAALAVMERPDAFHAAVAGAPVTEWKWYDTGYTERYLGNPVTAAETYRHNSLLWRAEHLRRPLMLVHGLADDNVVMAHTLNLSNELLKHGKAHTVLPLSGVTHMTPQEVVAENLMLLTVDYFKSNL